MEIDADQIITARHRIRRILSDVDDGPTRIAILWSLLVEIYREAMVNGKNDRDELLQAIENSYNGLIRMVTGVSK